MSNVDIRTPSERSNYSSLVLRKGWTKARISLQSKWSY